MNSQPPSGKDKVNWEQVRKWVARAGLKTQWKPYGMPEVLDPFGSRFADVDPMPKWKIPPKVMISSTITGAFWVPPLRQRTVARSSDMIWSE